MPSEELLRNQILDEYERLESGETDTWSPLSSDWEMFYRMALMHAATNGIRKSRRDVRSLKILDVGCGNGRSTRMYLDLGLMPEQLTGIDFRTGTIALAKRIHPLIEHEAYDGNLEAFSQSGYNWVQMSTVMSSIKEETHRVKLMQDLWALLPKGGFLLYFDMVDANAFAGGGRINPMRYFVKFNVLLHQEYYEQCINDEFTTPTNTPRRRLGRLLKMRRQKHAPSHEAFLLQK